jgi:ribosomal protein L19
MVLTSVFKKKSKSFLKILKFPFFKIGDIIKVSYIMKYKVMLFKGICIAKKLKSFLDLNSSFILRSVHTNVALELCISLYNVKVFNIEISQYEKKRFNYRQSKLYYFRKRSNKSVIVKY